MGLALSGCGSGSDSSETPSPSDPSPSATAAAEATVRGQPESIEDLCGFAADGEYLELRPEGSASVLSGYTLGAGEAAAVLVAQLNGKGSCDWLGYAGWLTTNGVRVLALDLCGQGRATCAEDFMNQRAEQVDLAVRHLRDTGAQRVSVVGASMGAAIAQGVAGQVQVDSVVAVSPPPEWDGVDDVDTAADKITVPWLLVAAAADDIDPARLSVRGRDQPLPAGTARCRVTTTATDSSPTAHWWAPRRCRSARRSSPRCAARLP